MTASSSHKAQVLAPPTERLLKPKEVAAMYGVTIKTVRLWADAGKLPFVLTEGGHRRYPTTTLDPAQVPAPPVSMPTRIFGLHPQPPTGGHLLARVGWGYHSDDPGLFLVTPDTTWQDLGFLLASNLFSDAGHLHEFRVAKDGSTRKSWWGEGRADAPYYDVRSENFYYDPYRDEEGDDDYDGANVTVSEVVGHHWFAWFRFDFGDEHWLPVRFYETPPFPPGTDPVLIAPAAMTCDDQYGYQADEDHWVQRSSRPSLRPEPEEN